MPIDESLKPDDPWSDFAREVGAEGEQSSFETVETADVFETETETTGAETGNSEAGQVEAEEPPAEEPLESTKADPESSALEEGSASWDFLATELGLEGSRAPPEPETNPADDMFSDYTPTVLEEVAEVAAEEPNAPAEVELKSGRRKRSRGRGRRRSSRASESMTDGEDKQGEEATVEAGAESVGDEEESADAAEKPARRRRGRRRGKRGDSDPDEKGKGASKEGSGNGKESGAKGEADSPEDSAEETRHRKIPTWGEAISVVVDSNIDSRGKNAPSKKGTSKTGRSRTRKTKGSR